MWNTRSIALLGIAVLMLAGCAHDRSAAIPPGAMQAAEGTGRLQALAPYDGTVYVYNVITDKMIYSAPVLKMQTVVVEPDKSRVMVDDRIASEKVNLDSGQKRKIFFLENGSTAKPGASDRAMRRNNARDNDRDND